MMYWSGHMTAAGWVVSILWTLFILGLLAGAIAWLSSELGFRGFSGKASETSAQEILDRRLAKGELSLEQYKELRETIGGARAESGDGRAPVPSQPVGAHG